jgi:hypothetical protein
LPQVVALEIRGMRHLRELGTKTLVDQELHARRRPTTLRDDEAGNGVRVWRGVARDARFARKIKTPTFRFPPFVGEAVPPLNRALLAAGDPGVRDLVAGLKGGL